MKYVLDSSAALPWVLPEKDSAKAIQLRDDARNAVHELLAPDIFPAEVFNALLKAERTKRINVGEAKTLYASIGADIPAMHPVKRQLFFPFVLPQLEMLPSRVADATAFSWPCAVTAAAGNCYSTRVHFGLIQGTSHPSRPHRSIAAA